MARQRSGSWFAFLDELGLLDAGERRVLDAAGDVLRRIETEPTTKAYKLVTLLALLQDGTLHTGAPLDQVSARSHRIVAGDPRLVADVRGKAMPDPRGVDATAWARFWRKWPLEHLTNAKGGASDDEGTALFRIAGDRFEPTFTVPDDLGETFDQMVAELVDWRLAAYLLRRAADD